jgi:hypothetical protein
MPLTENQYEAVVRVVSASSRIEEAQLIPRGELTIRWRMEAAAAFLASLINHCKTAGLDEADGDRLVGSIEGENLAKAVVDLAVQRAMEIERQGHA